MTAVAATVAPPFASDRNFGRIVRPHAGIADVAYGGKVLFCPGRFFVRERTNFTKGEQAIIRGILRNRIRGASGDASTPPTTSENGATQNGGEDGNNMSTVTFARGATVIYHKGGNKTVIQASPTLYDGSPSPSSKASITTIPSLSRPRHDSGTDFDEEAETRPILASDGGNAAKTAEDKIVIDKQKIQCHRDAWDQGTRDHAGRDHVGRDHVGRGERKETKQEPNSVTQNSSNPNGTSKLPQDETSYQWTKKTFSKNSYLSSISRQYQGSYRNLCERLGALPSKLARTSIVGKWDGVQTKRKEAKEDVGGVATSPEANQRHRRNNYEFGFSRGDADGAAKSRADLKKTLNPHDPATYLQQFSTIQTRVKPANRNLNKTIQLQVFLPSVQAKRTSAFSSAAASRLSRHSRNGDVTAGASSGATSRASCVPSPSYDMRLAKKLPTGTTATLPAMPLSSLVMRAPPPPTKIHIIPMTKEQMSAAPQPPQAELKPSS